MRLVLVLVRRDRLLLKCQGRGTEIVFSCTLRHESVMDELRVKSIGKQWKKNDG